MSYQEDIQKIIDGALTEKTFSLEIIEKIKALKDKVAALELENKQFKDANTSYSNAHVKLNEEIAALRSKCDSWALRADEISKKEKVADRTAYEMETHAATDIDPKKYYRTVDRGLAVAMVEGGAELVTINRLNEKRVEFCLKHDSPEELAETYWRGQMAVEPQHYFSTMRSLKS